MEATNRENHDFRIRLDSFRGEHGQIGAESPGGQKNLARGFREVGKQKLLRVVRESRYSRRASNQAPGQATAPRTMRKLQDFRAMERKHQPIRSEGVEKLQ